MRHHIFRERWCRPVLVNRLAGIAMLACIGGQAALTPEAASQIRDLTSLEEVSELFGNAGPGVSIQELSPTDDASVFRVLSHRYFVMEDGTQGYSGVDAGLFVIETFYGYDPSTSVTVSGIEGEGFNGEMCPYVEECEYSADTFRSITVDVESERMAGQFYPTSGVPASIAGVVSLVTCSDSGTGFAGSGLVLHAETVGEDPVFGNDPLIQRVLRHLEDSEREPHREAIKRFRRFHRMFGPGNKYGDLFEVDPDLQADNLNELLRCQHGFYNNIRNALSRFSACINACNFPRLQSNWRRDMICHWAQSGVLLGGGVGGGLGALFTLPASGAGALPGGAIGGLLGLGIGVSYGKNQCVVQHEDSPEGQCQKDCALSILRAIRKNFSQLEQCRQRHFPGLFP